MKIQILSDEMASRIAAGEVVERPASAVKELIENSLDASATEIFISVEKSGTSSIRVSDNGEGMAPEDLNLAVERHATSKLKVDEDLFILFFFAHRYFGFSRGGSAEHRLGVQVASRFPFAERTDCSEAVRRGRKER